MFFASFQQNNSAHQVLSWAQCVFSSETSCEVQAKSDVAIAVSKTILQVIFPQSAHLSVKSTCAYTKW